ncbi:MAG: hypothetical protein R3B90_17865 [Planctomycetaceae bacterium]
MIVKAVQPNLMRRFEAIEPLGVVAGEQVPYEIKPGRLRATGGSGEAGGVTLGRDVSILVDQPMLADRSSSTATDGSSVRSIRSEVRASITSTSNAAMTRRASSVSRRPSDNRRASNQYTTAMTTIAARPIAIRAFSDSELPAA